MVCIKVPLSQQVVSYSNPQHQELNTNNKLKLIYTISIYIHIYGTGNLINPYLFPISCVKTSFDITSIVKILFLAGC